MIKGPASSAELH